jgi:threonine aldolase
MRRAIYEAELGDDVFGEDPTVNKLEQLAAQVTGKEAALFTSSGSMSNLIAVLAQTHPGDEIILGSEAHMLWYEVGAAAAFGGVLMRTIPNNDDGTIDLSKIQQTIRSKSLHFPPTTLLCLENTHNRCGGAVLTHEYTKRACELAHQHGLRVHIDGARIFNAAVALNTTASELVEPADSVCFCLSKGLSAPIGSLLCGKTEFIDKARKTRKMLGGGMRQAGVIAAAGIVSIEKGIARLTEDHSNAKRLAQGLKRIPGIRIDIKRVETNIVIFKPPSNISAQDFIKRMGEVSVRFTYLGESTIRAVTNRMVNASNIDEVLYRLAGMLKRYG